jgi:hypothetical protein
MPGLVVADRIRETSQTTGTGDYSLLGAATGFQAFSVLGANNLTPYFATDDINYEVGIGTVLTGPARLSRTTILASSNGGAAVNWGAGTRNIICGLPAALAFPRKLTKSVAGGAGSTTLTENESSYSIIEATGALTGNRNLVVTDTVRPIIVYNNTSGAFSLTVKTAAGSGVIVQQGKRALLFCDGVNVLSGVDSFAGDVNIAGTFTQGTNASGSHAVVMSGSTLLFKLEGDTQSQFQEIGWQNNSGTKTFNTFATGDAAGAWRFQVGGAGSLDFITGTTALSANNPQFQVSHTASPTRWIRATGSNGGNPSITAFNGGSLGLAPATSIVTGGATAAAGYTGSGSITMPNTAGIYGKNTCKAWCRYTFSGGVPTVQDHWNVSSLTDNGVGDITVNFANALGSANYAILGGGEYEAGVAATMSLRHAASALSTTAARIGVHQFSATLLDETGVCSVGFWGL